MMSAVTANIGPELPLVYVTVALLVVIVAGLWLYVRITQRPLSALAQALSVIAGAAICAVLLTIADALFPGTVEINNIQVGKLTIGQATGQQAVFVVAIVAVFSLATAVVAYILKNPKPEEPKPPVGASGTVHTQGSSDSESE